MTNKFIKYINKLYTKREIREASHHDVKRPYTATDAFLRDWNIYNNVNGSIDFRFNDSMTALVRRGGNVQSPTNPFISVVSKRKTVKLSIKLIKNFYKKHHLTNAQSVVDYYNSICKAMDKDDYDFRGHVYRTQDELKSVNRLALASEHIKQAFKDPKKVILRDDDVKRAGYVNCSLKNLKKHAIKA